MITLNNPKQANERHRHTDASVTPATPMLLLLLLATLQDLVFVLQPL